MAQDNFMDGNHAMLQGIVVGQLMKVANGTDLGGTGLGKFEVEQPVDDDGDYLSYFYIHRPSGRWRVSIDPA